MLACNALPGASLGNCDVDSTDSSSKVCTLRCGRDPAVSENSQLWEARGRERERKQYWTNAMSLV